MTTTPTQLPKLPDEQTLERLLSKVKIKLFYHKGAAFLATIMCSVQFEWDTEIPTAATNGKKIIWNPYFFMSIHIEERVFVLAHELYHIAFQHIYRRNSRDPMIYNIAGDHVINNMLINNGYSVSKLGFNIFADHKYHNWSVDRVYEDIMQNPPPNAGKCGLADDLKEEDIQPGDQMESIGTLVAAIQASKMAGEAGVIPGDIEELIQEFLNPILPWEVLIQNFLNELSYDDYSYRRPNRRYDDPLLPSLTSDGALEELNWYIDVSGSITGHMLKRFFSEMKYVIETFNPVRVNIIQFDTRITKVSVFEQEDDFTCLEVSGRGGTNLSPVKAHIEEKPPNAAIIFSDMECAPMDEVNIPVLWCVFKCKSGSSYSHTPKFGTVIDIKE